MLPPQCSKFIVIIIQNRRQFCFVCIVNSILLVYAIYVISVMPGLNICIKCTCNHISAFVCRYALYVSTSSLELLSIEKQWKVEW